MERNLENEDGNYCGGWGYIRVEGFVETNGKQIGNEIEIWIGFWAIGNIIGPGSLVIGNQG